MLHVGQISCSATGQEVLHYTSCERAKACHDVWLYASAFNPGVPECCRGPALRKGKDRT
jgi:hypothetical protein